MRFHYRSLWSDCNLGLEILRDSSSPFGVCAFLSHFGNHILESRLCGRVSSSLEAPILDGGIGTVDHEVLCLGEVAGKNGVGLVKGERCLGEKRRIIKLNVK